MKIKILINILSIGIGSILLLIWLFCFKSISPGYVGVVVDLLGDKKGVEAEELHVGMHWIAPWKSVYQFPIFEQNTQWEGDYAFNFQTSEGMAISADIGITFHLQPEFIPVIFQRYRRGMEEITNTFIRNFIRDALNKASSKTKIEELYSSAKERFFDEIENHVKNELSPIGIEISRIYLIGRFHFPQNVIAALNAKIEANQRAQQRENELREAEAEAKKKIATAEGEAICKLRRAEADAKSNEIISGSLTKELIEWEKVQKWDGVLPKVSGGGTPLLNIGEEK